VSDGEVVTYGTYLGSQKPQGTSMMSKVPEHPARARKRGDARASCGSVHISRRLRKSAASPSQQIEEQHVLQVYSRRHLSTGLGALYVEVGKKKCTTVFIEGLSG
jgi:hypothetical protein